MCACVPGDVHQIDIWWSPRYHWNHREREFLFHLDGSLTVHQILLWQRIYASLSPKFASVFVFCLPILPLQSPADQCKKIHAGDEVIQVNHQTVVSLKASKPNSVVIKNNSICTFYVFPLCTHTTNCLFSILCYVEELLRSMTFATTTITTTTTASTPWCFLSCACVAM